MDSELLLKSSETRTRDRSKSASESFRWLRSIAPSNEHRHGGNEQQKQLEDALQAAKRANEAKTNFLHRMSRHPHTPQRHHLPAEDRRGPL